MADVWETAVRENDAAKLSRLVLLSAASPQAALEIVRSCAVLLQKEARTSGDANREWFQICVGLVVVIPPAFESIRGPASTFSQGTCIVCLLRYG